MLVFFPHAELRSIRQKFVTKQVVRKYLSEIHGLKGLKKLEQLHAAASTQEEKSVSVRVHANA